MIHASLFSGIGGFDLAAEWAGWNNAFNCEIDPFCRQVLKYHFPYAIQYDDVKTTDFTVWRGKIDVLTGGFPCQPFSTAGKRKGTSDDRYLWPEMLRAIREIRPKWVVGENVLGIVNWNGGVVFEQVHSDLETEGYEVQSFILPACGVGAPHQRYRTWFVAHRADAGDESMRGRKDGICANGHATNSCFEGLEGENKTVYKERQQWMQVWYDTTRCNGNGITPNHNCERRYQFKSTRKSSKKEVRNCEDCHQIERWENFPTQPPVCSRDDGFPIPMDGITFPKWRSESIKAYGNAIVPQVALQIFKAINQFEES